MPTLACPNCDRGIARDELRARTVPQPSGFGTNYRCPFCRGNFENVAELL
ncbi:hypothetical protein MBEHAL_0100 [Halarchaeum acidiphilum MH1-52-1]|uniref:Small CPxCG-related zinc finger protein n=1 Tax=Halarchaeum acidiphilum MH1-52-1 TaxID=1261545 RepID=U2YQV9_9EURY|nr:hypothetical protein [Halarchaeum acidiphilum]GAD51340.1 hypothetical protein MBEHAL_0100 [Halarchaeum acidiphilum MH1-52-1]